MKKRKGLFLRPVSLILFSCLLLCGCDNSGEGKNPSDSEKPPVDNTTDKTIQGSRDNTPIVLTPVAGGITVHSCDVASVDVSNLAEGYIVADYFGANEKVKLQITGPDEITYTYNLHGGQEVFPLTSGNGIYRVGIYENISGTTYSTTLSAEFDAVITNEFGPYLYPNQYVNFNATSLPVGKAVELAYPANNNLEVVEQVYNYIIGNFTYDYEKAENVATGYLPVVDEVYQANTGICFDYAAVMATMLRSQNIPTRLEVGYLGEEYHAWISIYIEDMGWVNGIIEFDGVDWRLLDPTFASTSKNPTSFTSEDAKYITKYVY